MEFERFDEEDQAQYHKKMQPYSKKIILPLCHGPYMIFLMFQIKLGKWPWQRETETLWIY
jgi:hypothetical protein